MNKPWAVVKHVSFEGPALVGTLLAERGIRYTEYPMYRASELPAVHDIGGLVVMGGPMGARDDVTRPQLPRERNFIKEIVGAGLPMLGICLGAQLLAASFGSDPPGADPGERCRDGHGVRGRDARSRVRFGRCRGARRPLARRHVRPPRRRGPAGEQSPLRESGLRDRPPRVRVAVPRRTDPRAAAGDARPHAGGHRPVGGTPGRRGSGRTDHDRLVPRPRRELRGSGERSPMSFAHRCGLYR
ncbi:glutamine amidotransferase-related protein [Rhodococcus sp. JS3073]|uniref:glutamine amidotransferase-related protein n=1 Tax=Rhodococcus sp. JS3073 TaxID=3002901 RepID=UPI003FA7DEA9